MSGSIKLKKGADILDPVPDDTRKRVASLASIANAANYYIGFSGIEALDEPDGKGGYVTYDVVGGTAAGGWVFEKTKKTEEELSESVTEVRTQMPNIDFPEGHAFTDSEGRIMGMVKKLGFLARKFQIVDKNGNTLHEITSEFMQLVTELLNVFLLDFPSDAVVTTDKDGRILQTLDKDGASSSKLNIKNSDGEIVLTILGSFEDGFSFCDKDLRIMFRASQDGLQAFKFLDKDGKEFLSSTYSPEVGTFNTTNQLFGKKMVTICDSLGVPNIFQQKVAELTGVIYDTSANNHPTYPISYGGTQTLGTDAKNGQTRVQNIAKQGLNPDIILYQNVNDGNAYQNIGSIDDVPFILKEIEVYNPIVTPLTKGEAQAYFYNNFAAIAAATIAKVNKALQIPYDSFRKGLTIDSAATSDGEIIVTVNGIDYAVNVTVGMTTANIAAAIEANDFSPSGCNKSLSGSTVYFYGDVEPGVSLNENGTGISFSIGSATNYTGYFDVYFVSKDVTDWSTVGEWAESITLYSVYKGVFEYLLRTFPKARIGMLILDLLYIGQVGEFDYDPTHWYPDGTFNMTAYKAYRETRGYTFVREVQVNIAKYYSLEVFEVDMHSKLTPINLALGGYYKPGANVHPENLGQIDWGETLARLLNK